MREQDSTICHETTNIKTERQHKQHKPYVRKRSLRFEGLMGARTFQETCVPSWIRPCLCGQTDFGEVKLEGTNLRGETGVAQSNYGIGVPHWRDWSATQGR